jgi:hypothetical protein
MNLRWVASLVAVLATGGAGDCWAWDATGQRMGQRHRDREPAGQRPEFIRAPEAAAEIAVMGRELDRSKGAGKTHDAERDPAGWPRRSKRSAARPASTLRRASSEIFSV